MAEQWIKWEPIKELGTEYYIESITSTIEEGFKIILSSLENQRISILFVHSIDSYTRTNKNCRPQVIDMLDKIYGKEFYKQWIFFKIKNSSYIQWMSEQSSGFADDIPFIHFSLICIDSILDVIAPYEPIIEFIK